MLLRIFRHEWRAMRADRAQLLLLGLFLLLIGYGVYNGQSWATKQQRIAGELMAKDAPLLREFKTRLAAGQPPPAGSGARDLGSPYSVSVQKWNVALPPAPLAALSVGQSDLYAQSTQAHLWSTPDKLFAQSEPQNPANLQAGRFDVAFVVIYLFPLLLLACSYNLLSAEREDGTLALLLSQPVSLIKLIAGKALARGAWLIGSLVIASLSGLSLAGINPAKAENVWPLLLWAALVVGYGMFWLGLAALVNLYNCSSATNALTLVAAWLTFVIVIPSLLNSVGSLLYQVPPRAELIIADRDAGPDVKRDGRRVLDSFFEDHPELRPASDRQVNEFRSMLLMVFLNNLRSYEPLARRYDETLTRQQSLVRRLGFLSPAVVTQEAMNDLAGTGFARYRGFRRQVNEFVQRQRDYFVPKVLRGDKMTAADFDAIPMFNYEWEPLAAMSERVATCLLCILLASAVCLCGVALKLRRSTIIG